MPAYSKLPSTYLTIRDVLPICESPTIPTFRTTLYHSMNEIYQYPTTETARIPSRW